jgi:hypothetical protein
VKKKPVGSRIGIHSIKAPKRDVPKAPDIRTLLERQSFETFRLKAEILKRKASGGEDTAQ